MLMMIIISMLLILVLLTLFNNINQKSNWNPSKGSVFECGFMSFYFERMSMSVQYYMIAILFLILDLEFCILTPYLMGDWYSMEMSMSVAILLTVIILSMMIEWKKKELNWKM